MNILVINGSPKGNDSITLQTVLYLEKLHPEHHFDILNAGAKIKSLEKDFTPAIELIKKADVLLFSYPVYTFIAPCQLHRFIELLKEHGVNVTGKIATQITTSKHFYDVTAHRYIQDNCQELGMNFIRGLSADMEDLTLKKGQKEAMDFWNKAFTLSDEDREKHDNNITAQSDLADLAISKKLANFVRDTLKGKNKVLDYGCGEGWAGMSICKQGCGDVTCVDVAQGAVETVKYIACLAGISDGFNAHSITADWLETVADNTYDGIVCTNVIDVVPSEISAYIAKHLGRILTPDGTAVIGMNYYKDLSADPGTNVEIKNGNEVYMDGILRMVSRTDSEWRTIFEQYFKVEHLEYYAWNSETVEKRRIFVLKKKI